MVERMGKRRTDSIREQKLEKRREGWLGRGKKVGKWKIQKEWP